MSLPFSTAISKLLHSSHISYPVPNSRALSSCSHFLISEKREAPASDHLPHSLACSPSHCPLRGGFSPVRLYSPSIIPSQESLLSKLSFTPDSSSPAFKHASPEAISRRDYSCLSVPHKSKGQEVGKQQSSSPIATPNLPPPIPLKPHPLLSPLSTNFTLIPPN